MPVDLVLAIYHNRVNRVNRDRQWNMQERQQYSMDTAIVNDAYDTNAMNDANAMNDVNKYKLCLDTFRI